MYRHVGATVPGKAQHTPLIDVFDVVEHVCGQRVG